MENLFPTFLLLVFVIGILGVVPCGCLIARALLRWRWRAAFGWLLVPVAFLGIVAGGIALITQAR